jgi:hypothetical protein
LDETLRPVSEHARNKYIKGRSAHVADCGPTEAYKRSVGNGPCIINTTLHDTWWAREFFMKIVIIYILHLIS